MNIRGRNITLIDELPSTRFVNGIIDTWEQDTFDAIDKYVHGGVFIDIGAWCGIFSLYAAHVASRVIAFEPDPVAYDLLVRNVKANGFDRKVLMLKAAVWDRHTELTLHAHEEGLGSSMTGPSRRGGEGFTPETFTPSEVRSACIGRTVDLIKVDTEGSETHIVPGLLDWGVPIHLSLHLDEMDGPLDFGDRQVTTLVDHPHYPVVMLT